MRYSILALLLALTSVVHAQKTTPTDRRDSVRTPRLPSLSSSRSLPPSMVLELRRAQGKRTVVFHDTVRGSESDSTFTLADTAVSLSHIEWLDSQLVEIPELERFGSKVHFTYPPAIMVETQVQPVPFDTGLLAHMNPVSRDNLPFFDQSPMPLPLRASSPFEGYLEAGAGNLYLPITAGWISTTLSPRSYIDARAGYRARGGSAVRALLNASAGYHAQLGVDPAEEPYASTNLSFSLSYDSKSAELHSLPAGSESVLRPLSLFGAGLSLVGDMSDKFHYDLSAEDKEFRDGYNKGLTESGQDLEAAIHYDPYISHFRFIVEGGYHTASIHFDSSRGVSYASHDPNMVRAMYAKAFFGRRKGEAFEWYGGVAILQGMDARGQEHSLLSPAGRIRLPLNPRWEAGGYFEPEIQIASERALSAENPFYSPYMTAAAGVLLGDTNLQRLDSRSVVLDRTRFGAFMDYALSPDDRIRVEARWTSRTGEPVFSEHTVDSTRVFAVEPLDTRRLIVSVGSNLLLFDRDVLTSAIDYRTATETQSDRAIPFEPTLKVNVAYHFNSVAPWLQPTLEFRAVSRTDRTITLVNAEAHVPLSPKISIFVRAENIAGSASDFWTGYEENPRSIWATVRLSF